MKKHKIYYKEFIAVFIFMTLFNIGLFFMFWYGYNPATCSQNIAYLAVFSWVVCLGILLRDTTFKKQ